MWAVARVRPSSDWLRATRTPAPAPPCLKKAFSLPLHLHDEGSHIVTTQCTDEKFNLPSGSPTAVEIQDSTGTKPVFLGVRLF